MTRAATKWSSPPMLHIRCWRVRLLWGVLVGALLYGCTRFEEVTCELPILPVAEAHRQAQRAQLAFKKASYQSDAAIARLERLAPRGPSPAYDRADAQSEVALERQFDAMERVLDAEDNLWCALQHQLGKDTESFWLAWDDWEEWKKKQPMEPTHNGQEQPYPLYELRRIRLGMKPVQVKLQHGEPTTQASLDSVELPTGVRQFLAWTYRMSMGECGDDCGSDLVSQYAAANNVQTFLTIIFSGSSEATMKVSHVCTDSYSATGKSEKEMIKKFGPWKHESIDRPGLTKLVSYPQLNVAFVLGKGRVRQLCMFDGSSGLGLKYREEYAGEHS